VTAMSHASSSSIKRKRNSNQKKYKIRKIDKRKRMLVLMYIITYLSTALLTTALIGFDMLLSLS